MSLLPPWNTYSLVEESRRAREREKNWEKTSNGIAFALRQEAIVIPFTRALMIFTGKKWFSRSIEVTNYPIRNTQCLFSLTTREDANSMRLIYKLEGPHPTNGR